MIKNIALVGQVMKKDCQICHRMITTSTGTPTTSVQRILWDDWKKGKLCPCFLSSLPQDDNGKYGNTENKCSRILRDDLKKEKLCSCFLLHALTTEQQQRVPHAEYFLEMIENDPDFVDSIITDDESWCFANDPPTKWQSLAWIGPKSP